MKNLFSILLLIYIIFVALVYKSIPFGLEIKAIYFYRLIGIFLLYIAHSIFIEKYLVSKINKIDCKKYYIISNVIFSLIILYLSIIPLINALDTLGMPI